VNGHWAAGEIEIGLIHSFTRFSAGLGSFYSGLNFIAKVFHNQNFMLAPPLSFVRFVWGDFGFVFFLRFEGC
jgi:hypothetical protein